MPFSHPAAAADTGLERAVQTELTRAKKELKDEGYPGIYHAALNIWDVEDWDRWSAMGSPRAESRLKERIVQADVRVGSAALDNHAVAPRSDYQGTPVSLADDEFALRHSLWRVLDASYKNATADYLRKQERLVAQGKAEYDTDDQAPEPPVVSTGAQAASPWDLERLGALEDALSEPFRRDPSLLSAESHVSLRRLWSRRRDTDGTAVDKDGDVAHLEIEAAALSPDGLRETVSRDWSARAPDALPSEAEVRRAGRELLADLQDLRVAATTSPFSAPALIDPSVSVALVYALGQRLSGEEQRNPAGAQTYQGRLGAKIVADTLTLTDDPRQASFHGRPLFGHYDFDDEGVPARRVVLIERGVLRGFLLSRYPVKGFSRSNGHGRAAVGQIPSGTPGVLFLSTSDPQPADKLLARLREECRRQGKPYGLWVRDLRAIVSQQGSGGQGSIRLLARVELVPADGGKNLRVRDLDVVGTPLVMAESVLAAGDDAEPDEANFTAPASIIAPSLLLAEAELQRSETKPEKSPILAPPQPFMPEPEAKLTKRAAAKGELIQVNRYLLAGRADRLESFDVPGVAAWRQTRLPDGLTLDVKILAPDRKAAAAAVRRADMAAAGLVKGGVHKTILYSLRAYASYRARYEDGWPDEGPR
ncbi:MAG: metallopeptidase TldD-related protein [Elusimicrobiota bacterium]